jgi:hypothetical protein
VDGAERDRPSRSNPWSRASSAAHFIVIAGRLEVGELLLNSIHVDAWDFVEKLQDNVITNSALGTGLAKHNFHGLLGS